MGDRRHLRARASTILFASSLAAIVASGTSASAAPPNERVAVVLPARASDEFVVGDPRTGIRMRVAVRDARPVSATERGADARRFPGGGPFGSHLSLVRRPDGVEDYIG